MTTIITQRHLVKFYIGISIGFSAYMAMGLASGFAFFDMYRNGNMVLNDFLLLIMSPVCLFMAFYTVIRYFKNSPIITVDKSKIKFNNETFLWEDIDKIELTGKKPFRYIINIPIEGTLIHFKDGRVKYFYDDMYSNSWQLKSFIQQVVINKQDNAEILTHEIDHHEFQHENFEVFKGNQFTSWRGILLWGVISFSVFMLISTNRAPSNAGIIFSGILLTFWFTLYSYCMGYFALSDKFLVIKNHNFIWRISIYNVEDIKEIVFESNGYIPNCLRVVTKDFQNKLYPGATLRDRTWLDLKEKLELKGVIVRNECIYQRADQTSS